MATYSAVPRKTPWLRAAWGSLDRNLKRLMLVNFIEVLAVSFYASVLMPYYRSMGYGSETAGVLTSVMQVVSAVMGVAAGFLADNLGRKRLFTAGQLLRCLAAGLLLVSRSYAGLVLVSVVRGLAVMQSPAQSAMLASYTKKATRGTHFGLSQTVSMFAQVTGPLAAGLAADRYGVAAAFAVGLVLAAAAVLVAVPLKERGPAEEEGAVELSESTAGASKADTVMPRALAFETSTNEDVGGAASHGPVAETPRLVSATRAPGAGLESPLSRVARMFRENRPLVLCALFAANFLNGTGNGAASILLPFTIMDRFSSAYTTVSASQSVGAIGTMLVLLIGGRIADVHGRRSIILTSGAIFPVLMFGLFAVGSLWQLYALLILITMVGNIGSPAISAVYMEAVGERDRATFAGLQLGLNAAGLALGMVCSGIAYRLNPTYAWAGAILAFGLQLPLYSVAVPRTKAR